MKRSAPKQATWTISLILSIVGLLGALVAIPNFESIGLLAGTGGLYYSLFGNQYQRVLVFPGVNAALGAA